MAQRGVNKVILLGNLGNDPEIRYMPNGGAVANMTIATSESWRDKQSGETKEKTEWHRVVIFGKLAEIAAEYLKKGSKVYIEGQLQTRKWTDNAGVEKYTTEIVLNVGGVMQMLDSKPSGQQSQSQPQQSRQHSGQQQQQQRQTQRQQQSNEPPMDFSDDIPF